MRRSLVVLALALPLSASATVRPLLRAGDPFPGGTVSTVAFWDAEPSGRQLVIQVYGTIAGRSGAQGALLRWTDGQIETLAREGDVLPGGVTYSAVYDAKINGAGLIAFSHRNHIYLHDGSGFREVVNLGSAPAGRTWSGLYLSDLTEAGDLLFDANEIPSGGTGWVHTLQLRDPGGAITELLRAGAYSVEGDLLDRFQSARMNVSREVVLGLGIDAIYRLAGGTLRRVFRPGDPLPGGGVMQKGVTQAISDLGSIAFAANLGATEPGQLVRIDGGVARAVTVEGQPTPWGWSWSGFDTAPSFNRLGDMVFHGDFLHFSFPQFAVIRQDRGGRLDRVLDEWSPNPWDGRRIFGFHYPQISDTGIVTVSGFIEGQPDGGPTLLVQVVTDTDGDGIDDDRDPCVDPDQDGFGYDGSASGANVCPPDDCPAVFDPEQLDRDEDGIGDACDSCPQVADPNQADTDGDDTGDACDPCTDIDADGFGDSAYGANICAHDNCPGIANKDQADIDGDGRGDACDNCVIFPNPDQSHPEVCAPVPLAGLSAADLTRFTAGRDAFARIAGIGDGLGPVFNGPSCATCHNTPAIGGASVRAVTRFGRTDGKTFDPLPGLGGSLLQEQAIALAQCGVKGEVVPGAANVVGRRETPPLLGLGLVAGIADLTILKAADPDDRNGDGISGRPNMVNGRVGRFGWKAQAASLADVVGEELLGELGVTSPAFREESRPQGGPITCDTVEDPEDDGTLVSAVTDFVTLLAPPPVLKKKTKQMNLGRKLFRSMKCHLCHSEKLRTEANAILALSRKRLKPLYSDLLLHDLGPELADGVVEGEASGSEFRTAPLWGVATTAPYLHDGRAATLEAAILAHGGEARASRDYFAVLLPDGQAAVLAFLGSL